jgi:hypothetical protein
MFIRFPWGCFFVVTLIDMTTVAFVGGGGCAKVLREKNVAIVVRSAAGGGDIGGHMMSHKDVTVIVLYFVRDFLVFPGGCLRNRRKSGNQLFNWVWSGVSSTVPK